MYETYWDLQSNPFAGSTGAGWFYDNASREEALARLHYLVERRRRCGLVTGAAGTGKSALLAAFADELRRSGRQALPIDLCGTSADELPFRLADALHLDADGGMRPILVWRSIRDHLRGLSAAERQIVLVCDQFDRAADDCTGSIEKLLHLVDATGGWCTLLLVAESPVDAAARLADLRIELSPLTRRETACYVYEAIVQAGGEKELFEPPALDAVYSVTAGVPREINRLCELSLLAGMADERRTIDAETVLAAAENLPTAGTAVIARAAVA